MTTDGQFTYSFDSRKRFTSVVAVGIGSVVSTYQYDAEGNRVQKTIAGITTKTLHEGMNPVRELAGATGTSIQADYISAGLDNWISRIADPSGTNQRRDFVTDHLGSTIALTNENKEIKTSYSYDPYGRTVRTGDPSDNPFQYTGRENDNVGLGQGQQAGLYYYRARYYSPQIHRFTQWDPIGLDGGINTFGYVLGNPISFTDPSGNFVPLIAAVMCIGGVRGAAELNHSLAEARTLQNLMNANAKAGNHGANQDLQNKFNNQLRNAAANGTDMASNPSQGDKMVKGPWKQLFGF